MLSFLTFFIIIPTSLIIVSDVLIRKRSNQDVVGRRSFLFCTCTMAGHVPRSYSQIVPKYVSANKLLLSPNGDLPVALVDRVGLYHIQLSSK